MKGLQKTVNICENFGVTYGVSYNPTKTVCIAFCRKKIQPDQHITLNGSKLTWCDKVKYHGIWLTQNLDDSADIIAKKGQFYGSVNSMCGSFNHLPCDNLSELFDTFCTSYYGSQCWSIRNTELTKLYGAYNNSVRRIWNLPFNSHKYIIHHLQGKGDFRRQLSVRFLKMLDTMNNSSNYILYFLCQRAKHDVMSCIFGNYAYLCQEYSINHKLNNASIPQAIETMRNKKDYGDIQFCNVKELRNFTCGNYSLEGLNIDEIELTIKDLSTM